MRLFVVAASVDGIRLGEFVTADAGKLKKAPGRRRIAEHGRLAVIGYQRSIVDQQDDTRAGSAMRVTPGNQAHPDPSAIFPALVLPDRYEFKPRCVAKSGLQIVSSTSCLITTPASGCDAEENPRTTV